MWRRNESAVISNSRLSPRSCQRASSTIRTKTSCCVSVGVKARKSCSPTIIAAAASSRPPVERPRMPERAVHLERRPRRAAPDPVAVAARPRRVARLEVRAAPPRRATTATSCGSAAFSASAARSGGGPPSTSTVTTFASACTPVSVRPATARPRGSRIDVRRAPGSARPRRSARPAASPSRGTRCRRTQP